MVQLLRARSSRANLQIEWARKYKKRARRKTFFWVDGMQGSLEKQTKAKALKHRSQPPHPRIGKECAVRIDAGEQRYIKMKFQTHRISRL